MLAWALGPTVAQGKGTTEQKAAFVYRVCQYVSWPDSSSDKPFVIAIAGDSEIEEPLREITADKRLKDRPIEVRRIGRFARTRDVDVVFVPEPHRPWVDRLVAKFDKKPTLTIGEGEAFADCGGMVALYFEGDRLALKLNARAAVSAGLEVSTKLIAVAENVENEP